MVFSISALQHFSSSAFQQFTMTQWSSKYRGIELSIEYISIVMFTGLSDEDVNAHISAFTTTLTHVITFTL